MSPHVTATSEKPPEKFFRVDDVIVQLKEVNGLQISKSTFLNGVRSGKYPQPIRVSLRRPVWTQTDIDTLIAAL